MATLHPLPSDVLVVTDSNGVKHTIGVSEIARPDVLDAIAYCRVIFGNPNAPRPQGIIDMRGNG